MKIEAMTLLLVVLAIFIVLYQVIFLFNFNDDIHVYVGFFHPMNIYKVSSLFFLIHTYVLTHVTYS